jgi:hypothetical protein
METAGMYYMSLLWVYRAKILIKFWPKNEFSTVAYFCKPQTCVIVYCVHYYVCRYAKPMNMSHLEAKRNEGKK